MPECRSVSPSAGGALLTAEGESMDKRVGEYVLSGELRNTKRNSVHGWLTFGEDFSIRIELTGNFSEALHQVSSGKLRFKSTRDASLAASAEELPPEIEELADRQIGVVARLEVSSDGRLLFEWHSQDGYVQANVDTESIEYVDEPVEGGPDASSSDADKGIADGYAEIVLDENRTPNSEHLFFPDEEDADDPEEADEPEDPYGLFGGDIDRKVAEALGKSGDGDADGDPAWQSAAEGMDPEARAMYEQWDEIFEGKKDQPISYLFREPLRLPRPERVESVAEAEQHVRAILAQLALLSVALDVCEHFSALDTYRLLMEEILPTAKVHPKLSESEMVQHYSTSDHCMLCERELDLLELPDSDGDSQSGEGPAQKSDSETDRDDDSELG